jgi:hypothetical protein
MFEDMNLNDTKETGDNNEWLFKRYN